MRNNYPNLSNNTLIKVLQLRKRLNKLFLFFSLIVLSFNSYGQCNVEIPTAFVSANFDDLSVSTSTSGVCVGLLGCGIYNEGRLIDASLTNSATASFGALGLGTSHRLRVTDGNSTYSAGTFAGFKIAPNGRLLSLDLLNGITIRTFNNNNLQETFSGASLLGLSLLSSPTDYIVGFNSTLDFDAIEIVLNSGVSVLSSTSIYHAVVRAYCAGPELNCNAVTKLSLPTYPMAINPANTGMSGISVGSVSNVENAINSNDADYASINLTVGVAASGSIGIKDQLTDYPAGTYAGLEIENANLLSVSAIGNVVVSTYLNGAPKEQFSGTNLVANAALLSSGGRFKLGFVSTQAFDEVKLSVNQTVGLSLGTTRVYGAVFQKFCAGPDLPCNVQTAVTAPTYPVYINNVNSGINGLVCALCTVTNQDNLIDADLTNYASVNLSVGVGTTGSLSVKDQIVDYPAGTFAGYTIENPALLNVDALGAVRLTTYLNGVQQETKSGNGPLVAVGTDLLVGTGKQTIGFVATMPFDEVRIIFQNLVSVNLGEVKVYNPVFQKLCSPVVECDETYVWSNPDFPVTINRDRTGIDGVACVACAVNNTDNLLTASQTDFANITLIAGVVGSGSVAVKDELFTYPKGTFAGYVIRNLGTLAQVNLLQSLVISTYNNGVLQEARSAGQLIDLSLLGIEVLGSVPGVYNVGFKTNLAFDEIRLTLNSVASVINSIDVYGAFVETSESDGGTLLCNSSSISVEKDGTYVDVNLDGIVNAGDRIDYTFDIKNTGYETLTNVVLTDNNATVTGTPIASLAAGSNDNTTYTATYTITQADVDAGVVYNLATVVGQTNLGSTITATSTDPTPCATCPVNPVCATCTATPLNQDPKLGFVKTGLYIGNPLEAEVGDTIAYTFTVTNTGNVTVNNVVINDAQIGVTNLVVTPSDLDPLQVGVATYNYIVTQADIDAGKITNSAIAVGQDPQGNDVQDISGTTILTDDSTVTNLPTSGKLVFVKTGVYNGDAAKAEVGDSITYTFTVANTGNVLVSSIVINDPKLGLINHPLVPSSLNVNENTQFTQDYILTQADIDVGKVINTAIARGQDPDGNTVLDVSGTTIANDDSTETDIPQSGALAFVKTAVYNGDATKAEVGDTITYTFAVRNAGNVTVEDIVINDPKLGAVNLAIVPGTLAPTESGEIEQDYIITQADIDAGVVSNTAIAIGQDPQGDDVQDTSGTAVDNDDSTDTTLPQSGSLAFVKTAVYKGDATKAKVGDEITYTFTVINTGNVTVKDIVINDPKLGLTNLALIPATLAPSEFGIITQDYTITQADIDAGVVSNTATAIGQDPQGEDVEDTSGTAVDNDDSTDTTLPKDAAITFVKTAEYKGDVTKAAVGDVITYTFTIRNSGNVTVEDIVINDAKLGITDLAIVPGTLAPTESGEITQDYVITQADIDAGVVSNTAIAKGQDPQGEDVEDTSGTAVDNDDSTDTTLPKDAAITFVKTAEYKGDATKAAVGDIITYTFTVRNSGNVTVEDIVINDAKLGITDLAIVPATLAPTESGEIEQDYIITQADIDAGVVSNTAIAKGQDPQGENVEDTSGTAVDNDDSTDTTLPKDAAITFVKTAEYKGDATKAAVGDVITYTFTVRNSGNVTVEDIVINDAKLGMTDLAIVPGTLAPTESGEIEQDYVITQADIDAGIVSNTAIAKGQDPQGEDVEDTSGTAVDNDDSTDTTLPKDAAITFVKTAEYKGDATKAAVGDIITYTFIVRNSGNVTVEDIVINDAKLGITDLAIVPATLAPTESGEIEQDYVITQADIDAGVVSNTAIAIGQDPQGEDVEDTSGTAVDNDDSTDTTVPKDAAITFVKTAEYKGDATKAAVGDIITYTFTVRNSGNVTVEDIVINDAKLGITDLAIVPATLAPTESGEIEQDYVITQADIDAGVVSNTAIAKGQDPQGEDVEDTSGTAVDNDDSTDTTLPQISSIALVKTAVVSTSVLAGGTVTYTFAVRNTGNTTVSNIIVTDPMVGLTIPVTTIASLVPGVTNSSITGTYILTQNDIDFGEIENTALAVGQDPEGNDVEDISGTTLTNDDPTITELVQNPSISITKDGTYEDTNNDGITNSGDRINYVFEVRNTGNTTLTNVNIKDDKVAIVGNPIPTLAYNTSNTTAFTAVYVITQADIEAGAVYNLATVEATDPKGEEVTGTSTDPTPCLSCTVNPDCLSCTITPLAQSPQIALMLSGDFQDENNDGQAQIGETILFTYTIMNLGNVPLSNVYIEDTLAGLGNGSGTITMPIGAMDNTTYTASYSITQQDIIAGNVTNQATVFGTSPLGVVVQDLSDDDTPLEDDATVIGVSGCALEIFNAVAPNSNANNKILYIRGLDCYPDNSVQIFDRWGVKVYDVDGYDNNAKAFRGISEGRVTVNQSKGLPTGTYFYILNYVNKEGKGLNESGYLHLIND